MNDIKEQILSDAIATCIEDERIILRQKKLIKALSLAVAILTARLLVWSKNY